VWETDPTSRDTERRRRRLARDPEGVFAERPTAVSVAPACRARARPRDAAPVRYPVVVGGGTPFLPPVTEKVPLDLIETRTFGSRVIHERYGRARDDSE
jgi:hypothetical protein